MEIDGGPDGLGDGLKMFHIRIRSAAAPARRSLQRSEVKHDQRQKNVASTEAAAHLMMVLGDVESARLGRPMETRRRASEA